MSISPVEEEKQRLVLSRNVRILMRLHDVTAVHLANLLKKEASVISRKLNGHVEFGPDEIDLMAAYFNTNVDGLFMKNLEDNPPPKYGSAKENGKPAIRQDQQDLPAELPNSGRLVWIVEHNPELRALVEKTYMAKLTGKIDDLDYYLRNNILLRALKEGSKYGDLTIVEGDKSQFIEHYSAQYEVWKNALAGDVADVTAVMLSDNQVETVLSVILPASKSRFTQFLTYVVKECIISENTVDIEQLSIEIDKASERLARSKAYLSDYLTRTNHS
jgi:hypothetical protein